MKRKLMVPVLLMCCSALAASCTTTERIARPIIPDADRMDCEVIAERPTIPPEYVIDWTQVTSVEMAQTEHDAFVSRLREREGPTAGYIVALEGELFACADDAAFLRGFFQRLE